MSNWRLVGAFWPEAATAQKTNTQILLIFVISPRTRLEMKSHEDTQVRPRTSMATKGSDSEDVDALRRAFRRGLECADGDSNHWTG